MNNNIMIQNVPAIAWDGTDSFGFDIRDYAKFGWGFEVVGAIAADAVFTAEAAPASDADDCVAGAYVPVAAIATCSGGAVAGDQTMTIPAGTAIGTICGGTVPCFADAFMRLAATSGDTQNVRVVMLRHGPAR